MCQLYVNSCHISNWCCLSHCISLSICSRPQQSLITWVGKQRAQLISEGNFPSKGVWHLRLFLPLTLWALLQHRNHRGIQWRLKTPFSNTAHSSCTPTPNSLGVTILCLFFGFLINQSFSYPMVCSLFVEKTQTRCIVWVLHIFFLL